MIKRFTVYEGRNDIYSAMVDWAKIVHETNTLNKSQTNNKVTNILLNAILGVPIESKSCHLRDFNNVMAVKALADHLMGIRVVTEKEARFFRNNDFHIFNSIDRLALNQ